MVVREKSKVEQLLVSFKCVDSSFETYIFDLNSKIKLER